MAYSAKSVVIVYVFITFFNLAHGHPKNKPILDKLEDDVNKLKSNKEGIIAMIDALRTGLNEQLEAAEVDERDEDILKEVTETSLTDSMARHVQWKKRLENLERDMNVIHNYLSGEKGMDNYLNRLPGDIMDTFENSIKEAENLVKSMKDEVHLSIDGIKSTLMEVDTSARTRNVVVAGVLYYGGIGSRCTVVNDDCQLPDSECRDGTCQCFPGLSYDGLKQECVESCSIYGNTYQSVPNRIIRHFNNATLEEATLDQCKQCCQDEQDFECKSFDFFPRWHACFLSEFTKNDVSDDDWEYNSAGTHFQRDCKHVVQN